MKQKTYKKGDKNQKYQGDISVLKIEKAECYFSPLPEEGVIVGHSESGHNHRVVKEREAEVEFGQDKDGYYIRVDKGTAKIIHEKMGGHEAVELGIGLHFFGKQYEYTDKEDRKVID